MTTGRSVKEVCNETYRYLESRGVENARAEAGWLVEHWFCCGAAEIADGRRLTPLPGFRRAVTARGDGLPLQYILGSQEFCGIDILVGKGVLIPRPETGVLVAQTLKRLPTGKSVIYDLCAGSGCVSLALAAKAPDAEIYAVEKYAAARKWLDKNLAAHSGANITAVGADILKSDLSELPAPDMIAANPPYITSGDLDGLQREVRREPASALDGGEDGLIFYRRIAKLAAARLKNGGGLCVEIGAGQAAEVSRIFSGFGLTDVSASDDEGGTERVISGFLPAF